MPKNTAQHLQITAVHKVKRSERMPQEMRVQPLYTRLIFQILKHHFNNVIVYPVPEAIEQKRRGRFTGALIINALIVFFEKLGGSRSHWYNTLLIAFTVDQQRFLKKIHVGNLKAGKLGTAKPAIQHQKNKTLITKPEHVGSIKAA